MAENRSTFPTLSVEIRCIIYGEVFVGARIVFPAAILRRGRFPEMPRRSQRLKNKLPSILRICHQCHVKAIPFLYANATVVIIGHVAAENHGYRIAEPKSQADQDPHCGSPICHTDTAWFADTKFPRAEDAGCQYWHPE